MKKEQAIPAEAVLGAIPRQHTLIYPYAYNQVNYEMEYTFMDQKDEDGNFAMVGIKCFTIKHIPERGGDTRVEVGGSYNTAVMHFVSHTLNTTAPRKNFEALLNAHIQNQNN